MRDANGHEIKIGDKVVFCKTNRGIVVSGVVVGFKPRNDQAARIDRHEFRQGDEWMRNYILRRHPVPRMKKQTYAIVEYTHRNPDGSSHGKIGDEQRLICIDYI